MEQDAEITATVKCLECILCVMLIFAVCKASKSCFPEHACVDFSSVWVVVSELPHGG